jgi:uncharacterized membrane protein YidH (DUF202 family)
MKRIRDEFGLTLVSIFAFAFLLNYFWESCHAVFLYARHDFNAEKYVRMVSYASAVDGFIIIGMYLFVSGLWRDLFWLHRMDRKQQYAAGLTGLVVAAMIEYSKVFVLKAWSYTPLMPTVFGIGLSPLIQISVTGLLAFWLTRRLLFR